MPYRRKQPFWKKAGKAWLGWKGAKGLGKLGLIGAVGWGAMKLYQHRQHESV